MEFEKNLEKGNVLMQQALKKYENGDFEGGNIDREKANEFFDKATEEAMSEEGQISQLYGESRNFGVIYNVFEQNLNRILEDKKKHNIVKEAYKLIKSNKLLLEQFKVYNNFEFADVKNVSDLSEYVKESVSLVKKLDKSKVKKANESFIRFMREHNLNEMVTIDGDTEDLYEAIEFELLNESTLGTVNDHIESRKIIEGYLVERKEQLNESSANKKMSLDEFVKLVESNDSKIASNLTEEEAKLLNTFVNEQNDREGAFNKYKSQTLDLITETIRTCDSEEVAGFKELYSQINEKKYSQNQDENIVNCAKMSSVIEVLKGKQ